MNSEERIKHLKERLGASSINHKDEIIKLPSLKLAIVYCVIHGISSQTFGRLLEHFE